MQTIVSEGQNRVKKGGSTNDYAGLPWGKTWLKKWLRDMWTLPNSTFEWLEIYEPTVYFPFGTRISFQKEERNIFLNISILILMLTLKSIKMRDTTINSLKTTFEHFHSTHN